jgi:hypothetical protein
MSRLEKRVLDSDIRLAAFPEDKIITKFTDYGVLMPDWLIRFIQWEMPKRDVRGLTNNVITKVAVSGEHPLVQITASIFDPKTSKVNISGLLPAISVVEGDEDEEPITIGNGFSSVFNIDQGWLDAHKKRFSNQKEALEDCLFTMKQVFEIETYLGTLPEGKQVVLAVVDGFFLKSNLMVGVWVQSIQERTIIGNALRSILYDSRKYLSAERGIKDIHFKTTKGIVSKIYNTILHGQETTIDYINYFHNVTVVKEIPFEKIVDLTKEDAVEAKPGYFPAYQEEDNKVQYDSDDEDIGLPEEIPGTAREEEE